MEKMQKAARARARKVTRVVETEAVRYESLKRRSDERMDLLRIVDDAERARLMADGCERFRRYARDTRLSTPSHRRLDRALRRWLDRAHRAIS